MTPPAAPRWALWWPWLRRSLQVGLPLSILWLVAHEIHALDVHSVRANLTTADGRLLFLGTVAAFLSVGTMGLYDALAFPRGERGPLGFGRRWLMGAVLFGWTNFVSMGPLGGPALRLFAYRRAGLNTPEITRGIIGYTIGSGAGLTAWLLATWLPLPTIADSIVLHAGIALLMAVGLSVTLGRAITAAMHRLELGGELHSLPFAAIGLVSFVDWGLMLVAFHYFVRAVGLRLDPLAEARTVLIGQAAGLISMLPGGIGSADAVWFKGFSLLDVPHDVAAAAVVTFRGGFYLLPWAVSLVVLYTVAARQSARLRLLQRRVVAGAVLLNALLLLLSAATPAIRGRLSLVERFVPISAIDASHLLATLSAGLMLFLVRGLQRGYRSAYIATMALLAASVIAHPLKGGDFEEAAAALLLMGLLFGVRKAFTKEGRIPIGWEVALAASVAALSFFLISGIAAFDHLGARSAPWMLLIESAEAGRFFRGALLLLVAGIVVVVRQAIRPARAWLEPTPEAIAKAEAFVRANADSAEPLLVSGGDKGIWTWEPKAGTIAGLVLYQRHGDRLIVFRDPIMAPGADPAGLVQALLAHAEDLDVAVVFSSISGGWMEHLHDFGFRFLKVNEEAIVSLENFSLQGGKSTRFRQTLRAMEAKGVTFTFSEPPFARELVDDLRIVSDAWLSSKGGRELQFSACYFSNAYIQRNAVAVAKNATGEIIAFVNVLRTRPGGPATLDLMRYVPNQVDGVMDFLIVRIMETLAASGASSLSLGAAPLADVGIWRGSRFAERAMHLFSTKAERLYNYRGLVRYKSKFHPTWEPRYIAYQQPWEWATALLASTRIVQARDRASRRRIAAARIAGP